MGPEHYCTLFDSKFLPAGLCLHESLSNLGEPFHLWILCMDELVRSQLEKLALPHATLIGMGEIESPELLAVKGGRTKGEYCWTLTPFLPSKVMELSPSLARVTYVDADLYFFASPRPIFRELDDSGAHALITEHAFDPKYERSDLAGRFCVQFMPFRNTAEAREILSWWQARCLEWCFAEPADGKFGDQKYLEQWPALFGPKVCILGQKHLALAPWNADMFLNAERPGFLPAFYHFHGLRLTGEGGARLFEGYRIGSKGRALYKVYLRALCGAVRRIREIGQPVPFFPEETGLGIRFRRWRQVMTGRTLWKQLG